MTCIGWCKKRSPAENSEAIVCSRHSRSDLCKVAPGFGARMTRGVLLVDRSFVRNSQFFAAFTAATGQYFTAIFGFHALTKTMLIFSFSFWRLKRPFHHTLIWDCKDKPSRRNSQSVNKFSWMNLQSSSWGPMAQNACHKMVKNETNIIGPYTKVLSVERYICTMFQHNAYKKSLIC